MLVLLKDGLLGLIICVKQIFQGITLIKRFIIPAAKTTIEHKETTFNLIQLITNIAVFWSQSLANKVIKAAKSIYDFLIYVSTEISKHRHSIYVTSSEQLVKHY